mmetsp:Transcript_8203/g.14862  ORF Transcript_8203/g.14862 Transcript_8203/m.14862 type:complete len:400 (-) Transcript_8203:25-1224(-)
MGNACRVDDKPRAIEVHASKRKRIQKMPCRASCYNVNHASGLSLEHDVLIVPEQAPPPVVSVQEQDSGWQKATRAWPAVQIDLLYMEHMSLLKAAGLEMGDWMPGSITAADTLLVIDMQNDYFSSKVAPLGGRMPVPEGESAVRPVAKLIQAFAKSGALIVATRDYHPADHASFYDQGGPYPPHCIQGTAGSWFYSEIEEALQEVSTAAAAGNSLGRVEVAFKGFVEEVDSFGAFRYDQEYSEQRMRHSTWDAQLGPDATGSSAGSWSGAMALKCSNLAHDVNAPPDLDSLFRKDLRPLDEIIPKDGRLLIVGLALDLGVLDSAVCASRLGYNQVYVAADASRATYFSSGEYGSGFLTDPAFIASSLQANGVTVVHSADVLWSMEQNTYTELDLIAELN